MFFASKVNSILGIATTPVLSALGVGLALTNLVLGGKVMAGTDNDAAANGVLFFGGWAVLNYVRHRGPAAPAARLTPCRRPSRRPRARLRAE